MRSTGLILFVILSGVASAQWEPQWLKDQRAQENAQRKAAQAAQQLEPQLIRVRVGTPLGTPPDYYYAWDNNGRQMTVFSPHVFLRQGDFFDAGWTEPGTYRTLANNGKYIWSYVFTGRK